MEPGSGTESSTDSETLEYSLDEFENGKIHVRLLIEGVEDTISKIYIK